MDILFLLVPLSVLLALAVMGVLAWAVWAGQFEELESESERILISEPVVPRATVLPVDTSLIQINTPHMNLQHTETSFKANRI
jgi:cbb3-type cytochrome oxidase maturation protein